MGLLAGFALVFAFFQAAGSALGSDRGQFGSAIAVLVIALLLAIERAIFGLPLRESPRALGLGVPILRGLVAALAVGLVLLATIPLYVAFSATRVELSSAWLLMLPGLFAQAGIAEEALFRGYLFGHIAEGRKFWRAAFLSALPFAAAHLFMFLTLPWPVALASLLLAVVMSFPLAHLYVLGGNTIWAPALVHFVVQGGLKIIAFPETSMLPMVWIAAAALVPLAVFLLPVERTGSG